MRPFKRGNIIELEIHDMAFGGKGISKVPTEQGDYVVFVPNTIPGQTVKARVVKSKSRFAECKLVEVVKPSAVEIELPYQPIPGAPYATLPIEMQEEYKKRLTIELYKRIGKVENIDEIFDEYIPSPSIWHYRNKMEYSFSAIRYDFDKAGDVDEFGLGFKHRGTWWMVENLDKDSGLFDEAVENNLKSIRQFCEDSGMPPWHPPRKDGFFRYLIVRKSIATNELLFDLVTTTTDIENFDANGFAEMLQQLLGDRFAGLIHSTNDDIGDRSRSSGGNGTAKLIAGKEVITEKILDLEFEMSMQSFFQTNPQSAEKLYSKALDYVFENNNLDGKVVMDLFCGTGTIGQILGSREKNAKVIGVDIVEDAIKDAQRNAERNGIENVEFYAADVGKFLYEYPEYIGKIGTIVLDPPRAGIAPKTLLKVIALNADRIVYVSCNPATQSRDAEILLEAGYELQKLSLVDQFPHTSHVEAVALFEKVK
jgi:23S rRNA (uracil1939-C5)-methyltransferase